MITTRNAQDDSLGAYQALGMTMAPLPPFFGIWSTGKVGNVI